MTNVLPPTADKRIRNEYRARFLLVGSVVILVCAGCFLFALVPAEIALATAAPITTPSASNTDATSKSDQAAIKNTQALLTALAPINSTSTLDALTSMLAARPPGISINSISYNVPAHTVTLVGTASSPDSVNAYRGALQSDPRFTNVSVPIGALLGQQNGGFTMTVSGTF